MSAKTEQANEIVSAALRLADALGETVNLGRHREIRVRRVRTAGVEIWVSPATPGHEHISIWPQRTDGVTDPEGAPACLGKVFSTCFVTPESGEIRTFKRGQWVDRLLSSPALVTIH